MANDEDMRQRAAVRPSKEKAEDRLLAMPGVTGVDIGPKVTKGLPTKHMAIVVYVKKKKPLSQLTPSEVVPKEIDGVPTDVVEEEIVLHAAGAAMLEITPQVDASKYTTLEGGISMGPCRAVYLTPPDVPTAGYYIFVGTLGVIVKDRSTGAAMALTNFHVACVDSTWSVGDTQCQPGRVDGGTCPADKFGGIARAVLSQHVDGSVITIDSGKAYDCSIVDVGDVKGSAAASVGMAVRKRGRTTELTYGTVSSVDYSTSIDYGDGLGVHTLKNQIRVTVDTSQSTQFADHGDSGSAVVTSDNKVVGLHFAGNTAGTVGVANPIQYVLDELSVDLCVKGATILTSPASCGSIVTRPVVCTLTYPASCTIVTKQQICAVVTAPSYCPTKTIPACPVITQACPPVSLACGYGPPVGGIDPVTRVPSQTRPGSDSGPVSWYGGTAEQCAEDAFWVGYYTALEALADAEAKRDGEQ
jgi:hypothetical protein